VGSSRARPSQGAPQEQWWVVPVQGRTLGAAAGGGSILAMALGSGRTGMAPGFGRDYTLTRRWPVPPGTALVGGRVYPWKGGGQWQEAMLE
jgi:hypothetical protein